MSVTAASVRRREIEAITVIGFGHGVSHFFHLMIPPLFPWLMRDFGLSFTQAGLLTGVFFTVSGIGQAAAGFVVDRLGALRVLLAGFGLFALSALLLAAAPGYAVLVVAAAVAGLGNSVFHPADFTLLNRNVSGARLGHAFSVHGLSANLGWAVGPVFMTGITVATHWRVAALAAAVVAVLAIIVFWLRREVVRDPAQATGAGAAEPDQPLFAFLRVPAVWMCFGFFLLITTALSGLQNFGPPVLHEIYGLSLAAGASALTLFLSAGAAGMVLGGFLVTRYEHHERIVAVVLIVATAFALVLAGGDVPAWSVAALMAAMGFFTGIAGPSRDMLVRRAATARFGQRTFGRVYGFVYSGLDVGLAAAPVLIFGPLMDADHFAMVLIGVAVAQGLAVLTALGVGSNQPVSAARQQETG